MADKTVLKDCGDDNIRQLIGPGIVGDVSAVDAGGCLKSILSAHRILGQSEPRKVLFVSMQANKLSMAMEESVLRY